MTNSNSPETTRDPDTDARLGLWQRPHTIYLATAFGISWIAWIGSWALIRLADDGDKLINADLVWALFLEDGQASTLMWLSLLSVLGVYGPMIAGIVATRIDPLTSTRALWRKIGHVAVGGREYGLVLGILVLVVGPAALIVALTADLIPNPPGLGTVLLFMVVFFAFQMVTSGTEEIGWRGYLNEKLRRGRNFWETGWVVGLPWAVWHYPIVVIMFAQQGMAPGPIVGSLTGFTLGIVAASILHAWFYERTRSVFLNMFIHATFNTLPLTTALLFQDSPAAVIANLALWAVVIYLKRVHDRAAVQE